MQLIAGSILRKMESNCVSLVSKNYEIERTIVQLKSKVFQMKPQHGEANKGNIRQDFCKDKIIRWIERKKGWPFPEITGGV